MENDISNMIETLSKIPLTSNLNSYELNFKISDVKINCEILDNYLNIKLSSASKKFAESYLTTIITEIREYTLYFISYGDDGITLRFFLDEE